jgi:antitoxin component HigA of HigAB toxin-antitoxin module
MREQKKYTQKEVDSNINILESEIEQLKLQRTELSQLINSKKKQVLVWSGLDLRQIKLF